MCSFQNTRKIVNPFSDQYSISTMPPAVLYLGYLQHLYPISFFNAIYRVAATYRCHRFALAWQSPNCLPCRSPLCHLNKTSQLCRYRILNKCRDPILSHQCSRHQARFRSHSRVASTHLAKVHHLFKYLD